MKHFIRLLFPAAAVLLLAVPLRTAAKSYDGVLSYHNERWEPVRSYNNADHALYIQLTDPDQDEYDSLSISVQGGLQRDKAEKLYLKRVPRKKGVFRGVLPLDFKSRKGEVDGDLDVLVNDTRQDTAFVTYIDLRNAAGISFPIVSYVTVKQFDIREMIAEDKARAAAAAAAETAAVAGDGSAADTVVTAAPDSAADSAAVAVDSGAVPAGPRKVGRRVKGTVSGVWTADAGAYLVTADLTVPAGSTLVLMPGTELRFAGHYRVSVAGFLDARGTDAAPVVFRGDGDTPAPDTWNGLFFEDSTSRGRFDRCRISHSYHGVYTYAADTVSVSRSRFRYNQYAAVVMNRQTGRMLLQDNDIRNGDYGIVCVDTCGAVIRGNRIEGIANHGISCEKNAAPLIEDNVITGSGATGVSCMISAAPRITRNKITDNSTGVSCINSSPVIDANRITGNHLAGIVCFGASAPAVTRNSLSGNRLFDLKNETANAINARGNWWGAYTTSQLKDGVKNLKMVYDRNDDPRMGSVDCSGFAGAPLGVGGEGSVAVREFAARADYECTVDWPDSTFLGDRVFLQARAQDVDPQNRDEIGVRVFSERTDPKGIMLLLQETGTATGDYRGSFIILDKTLPVISQVGAAYGERVTAQMVNDSSIQIRLTVNNKQPKVERLRVAAKDSMHLVQHAPTFTWRFRDEIYIDISRLVKFLDPELKKKVVSELDTRSISDPQRAIRVQVSTTAGFGDILWDSGEVPVADSQYTYAGDTLHNGRTYHVRIAVSDGLAWSGWSAITIRMNTPPGVPVPQTPTAGERVASLFPVFKAATPEDDENDKLFLEYALGQDSLFSQTLAAYADIEAGPAVTVASAKTALQENQRYFWRVRARDSWETGAWSAAVPFYADAVVEVIRPFSLLYPENEQVISSLTPSLIWEPTEDPDPGEDITYTLYLSTDPAFKDDVTVVENLTMARYDVPENLQDNRYYYWKVAARHGNSEQYADQTGWWFFTNGLNDPPRIRPVPDIVFSEDTRDSSLELDKYVDDVDNEKEDLVWRASAGGNIAARINPRNRRVTFSAPRDWTGGPEIIRFTVRDAGFDSATVAVNVTVAPVNDVPVLSPIPDVLMDEDGTAEVDLNRYVKDVETQPGKMQWGYRNQWRFTIAIDSANHAYITPPRDWSGRLKRLTMTVRDEDGGEAAADLSVTVRARNDAPVIDTLPLVVFKEEGEYRIQLDDIVHDVDDEDADLVWRYSGNRYLNVTLDPASRVMVLQAPPDWSGVVETLSVRVADPAGATAEAPLRVRVSSVNDPPELDPIPDLTIAEDGSLALDLGRYVRDVDDASGDLRWDIAGAKRVTVTVRPESLTALLHVRDDWSGEERLVFTVTDPQGASAQQRVRVTVTAVNDPPTVALDDSIVFNEDETFLIKLDDFVKDVDHELRRLTWKAVGQRQVRVTIDPAVRRATLSAPQDWFGGPEVIRFTATDPDGAAATDSVAVTVVPVNDVPVITGLPQGEFLEDETLTLSLDSYVSDVDNGREELTWSARGQQHVIVNIDDTARTVTFSAPQDWNGGPERITLAAKDPGGLSGTAVIPVTVAPVNDAPVMRRPDDVVFNEDERAELRLDDYISDVDNRKDEMTWKADGAVRIQVAIDPATRTVVFTAPRDWNGGPETIGFTAADPGGLVASQRINVTVTPVNDVPVISGLPKGEFREDERLAFALDDFVKDVDNRKDELVWSAAGNVTVAVAIDAAARTIAFSAPQNWNGGPENITLSARDPGGLTATVPYPVTVMPVNDAPVMTRPADITFDEDGRAELAMDDYISDVDNRDEQISWRAAGMKKVAVAFGTDRKAVLTAPQDWYGGPETVTLTGSDPGGLAASQQVRVTVRPVNDVPVITGPGTVTFKEDAAAVIALDDNVRDVDDARDKLTWKVTGGTGVSAVLDPAARTVRLSAPADWNGGPEAVTLSATDPGGLTGEAVVQVTVTPVNDAPVVAVIPAVTFAEDAEAVVTLDQYVADVDNADGDILWKATGGSKITAGVDPLKRSVTFRAPADWSGGPETFRLSASDPDGLSAAQSVTVTVTPVNDAPVFTGDAAVTFPEDETLVLELDKLARDVDNPAAELSWQASNAAHVTAGLDAGARRLTLRAPADWSGGPETVQLTVTDPAGLAAVQPLQVTVAPVNDPPVIKPFKAVTFEEDGAFALSLLGQAEDRDDTPQQLTWTLSGSPHVKGVMEGQTLRLTAASDWNGTAADLTVTVTDRGGLAASTGLKVTVTPVNDAPRFGDAAPVQCRRDSSAVFDLTGTVTDPDHAAGTLSWSAAAGTGLTARVSAAGVLTVTPSDPKWTGTVTVQVTATDPEGASASGTVTVDVVKKLRR